MSGFMDGGVVIKGTRVQFLLPVTVSKLGQAHLPRMPCLFERVALSGVYARGRKETIPHLEMGKSFCGEIE